MSTRIAKACERCRLAHKKCAPPWPCQLCQLSGVECQVRVKARPLRKRREYPAPETRKTRIEDPVEQMRALLQAQRCNMSCDMSEPRFSTSPEPDNLMRMIAVTDDDIIALLRRNQSLLQNISANVLDYDKLCEIAVDHDLADTRESGMTALLYACLAVAAHAENLDHSYYNGVSQELARRASPSIWLCRAYYFQHHYALRAGSCEQARALMSRAVQIAQDINLVNGTEGIEGLHLFFLIYMGDQYSTFTYSTPPLMRASAYPNGIFDPLAQRQPELSSAVALVLLNGEVLERLFQPSRLTEADVLHLEGKISRFCASRSRATHQTLYGSVATIHMLYCRLCLRIPLLSHPETWLTSLSICLHVAQEIISIYHDIKFPETHRSFMPQTWRQVKLIVLASLVIAYVYSHGEISYEDASRHLQKAKALLNNQRCGWRDVLDQYCRSLDGICGMTPTDREMQTLESVPYEDIVTYTVSKHGWPDQQLPHLSVDPWSEECVSRLMDVELAPGYHTIGILSDYGD